MSFYQSRLLLSKLKLHNKSISDSFQKLMSDGMKINDCKIYISAPEAKVVLGGGGETTLGFGLAKNYYYHSITLFSLLMVFRMEHQVVFCMCWYPEA